MARNVHGVSGDGAGHAPRAREALHSQFVASPLERDTRRAPAFRARRDELPRSA